MNEIQNLQAMKMENPEAMDILEEETPRKKSQLLLPPPSLETLLSSLETATQMAKYLPNSDSNDQILHIFNSLSHAHHTIQSFLENHLHKTTQNNGANNRETTDHKYIQNTDLTMAENPEEDNEDDEVGMLREYIANDFSLCSKRRKRNNTFSFEPDDMVCRRRPEKHQEGYALPSNYYREWQRSLDLVFQFHA